MKEKLTISDANGKIQELEILFTFESKKTNKKYVTYTDYSKDSEGNINCWSSILENGNLISIETEEELEWVNKILKTIMASTKLKYRMNHTDYN
ncbi:MAG: DUF1292 domain-containing protein, partial [Bacilli bacterium]|nr:DUF1292 domain-containing protein [Bacilli bacterium]